MTKLNEVYKCEICGNIVEVVHSGNGELVCCGQPMTKQEPKDKDMEGTEKHVPVIEKTVEGILVKVGEVAHPMEDSHYIEWIEIRTEDNKVGRKYLKPGDAPQTTFQTMSKIQTVLCYCNIHGLWSINLE